MNKKRRGAGSRLRTAIVGTPLSLNEGPRMVRLLVCAGVALSVMFSCGWTPHLHIKSAFASSHIGKFNKSVCKKFMNWGVFYLKIGYTTPDNTNTIFTDQLDPETEDVVRKSEGIESALIANCQNEIDQDFAEIRLFFDHNDKFDGSYISASDVECNTLNETVKAFENDRRYHKLLLNNINEGISARFSHKRNGKKILIFCRDDGHSAVVVGDRQSYDEIISLYDIAP